MCTVIALFRCRSDYPLVLATNRDEFYARPASGAVRLLDAPATVGGRDTQAGGTWLGVTDAGFFAAVTNQPNFTREPSDARSRGQLVLELLRAAETGAARRLVERVRPADYSDFNLLFGDAGALFVGYGRAGDAQVHVEAVAPGLHVLPNDALDSPATPKVSRVQTLLSPHLQAPWSTLQTRLRATLADGHTVPRPVPEGAPADFDEAMMRKLSALCVRTDAYGSRSSTIVALQPGRCAHYLYADGPPDETPFEDVTGLFASGA